MFDDLFPVSDFVIANDEVKAVEAQSDTPTWATGQPQDLWTSDQPQDLWTTK